MALKHLTSRGFFTDLYYVEQDGKYSYNISGMNNENSLKIGFIFEKLIGFQEVSIRHPA